MRFRTIHEISTYYKYDVCVSLFCCIYVCILNIFYIVTPSLLSADAGIAVGSICTTSHSGVLCVLWLMNGYIGVGGLPADGESATGVVTAPTD